MKVVIYYRNAEEFSNGIEGDELNSSFRQDIQKSFKQTFSFIYLFNTLFKVEQEKVPSLLKIDCTFTFLKATSKPHLELNHLQ